MPNQLDLSLETSSEINFEFINFFKQKQIGNISMFGNLRFITIFDNIILPNQLDLSAHFSLPFLDQLCPQTKMQQHIDFPMEISVIKFQAWQFDEKLAFQKSRFSKLLF